MRPFAYYFVFGVLLAYGQAGSPPYASQVAFSPGMARITTSLDADWRFLKGDAAGAETPAFDDAKWRVVNVPHDWSIEGPFDAKNPTKGAGGFLPAGIGWYRKHFTLPVEYARRRIDPARVTSVDPGFEPLVRRQAQFADWTPPDLAPHEETVEAYSNCEPEGGTSGMATVAPVP